MPSDAPITDDSECGRIDFQIRRDRVQIDPAIEGLGSPLLASPIVDIRTYHSMQRSTENNAHVIRIIDTFANRKKTYDIDLIKTNADAETDKDASLISCPRCRSRSTSKRPSPRSRRSGNTAIAPFDSHASNTPYSIQSHTMPTHIIQSIHLGPCLDQHPACGLMAPEGSKIERGALELQGGG